MKNIFIPLLLTSFLLSTVVSAADESPLRPCVPFVQQTLTGGGVVAGTIIQIPQSQAAAIPLRHFSSAQPAHALNHLKSA